MKLRRTIFLGMMFFALTVVQGQSAERVVTLAVSGMTCVSCLYIVEDSIREVEGVASVEMDGLLGRAMVTFDDSRTTVDAVVDAPGNYGFPATAIGQDR